MTDEAVSPQFFGRLEHSITKAKGARPFILGLSLVLLTLSFPGREVRTLQVNDNFEQVVPRTNGNRPSMPCIEIKQSFLMYDLSAALIAKRARGSASQRHKTPCILFS